MIRLNTFLLKACALVACLTCALGAGAYNFYMSMQDYIVAEPGSTIVIPVGIENDVDVTAFEVHLTYDEGLSVTDAELTDRIDPSATVSTTDNNNRFNVVCMNFNGIDYVSLEEGEGTVIEYTVTIPGDAEGDYTLRLETCKFIPVGTYGSSNTYDADEVVATIHVPSATKFEKDGFWYNITGENTVEVTYKNLGNTYRGDVTIPEWVLYNGKRYEVTAIGKQAFWACDYLTSVIIPKSVITIDEIAFQSCELLSSVTIGSSVKTIGDFAFANNQSLTSIVIPSSVTTIGTFAFHDCPSMTSLVIGSSVTSIGTYAFHACTGLTSVTSETTTPVPISYHVFADEAFATATLYVPKGCRSAYQAAAWWQDFSAISELSFDFVDNGVYYRITGNNTVEVTYRNTNYNSYSDDVRIPGTVSHNGVTYHVTSIGSRAFYQCANLKACWMADEVTSISMFAFSGCPELWLVSLSNNITTIGAYAFHDSQLTQLNCGGQPPVIQSSTFDSRHYTSTCVYVNSLTELEAYRAAEYWRNFNYIQNEGYYHFEVDGIYYNITGDNTVRVVSGNAIVGMSYEGDVVIPSTVTYEGRTYNVTEIGGEAFLYCSVTSVTFPASITSIGHQVFSGANYHALTSVTSLATTPPDIQEDTFMTLDWDSDEFEVYLYDKVTLYVPYFAINAYKAADYWMNFTDIRAVPEYDFEVDGICYNITGSNRAKVTYRDRAGNSYSGNVVIPSTVTHDGVTYTVTEIGYMAFYNCWTLTHVELPPTLTTIGVYAFYDCYQMDNVTIPESVTRIGTYAFCQCSGSNFTEVIIPDNVTRIDYGAFYGCEHLTKVTIGSGVQSMADDVFYHCQALTKVYCQPLTPPTITNQTFDEGHYSTVKLLVPQMALSAYQTADYWKNFTDITTLIYDFKLDGIYYKIFGDYYVGVVAKDYDYGTYSGSVVVPSSVQYQGITYSVDRINNNAFAECPDLVSVTLPGSLWFIDYNAFRECYNLTSITVPEGVTWFGSGTFQNCHNLSSVSLPHSLTYIGDNAFWNCYNMSSITIPENVTYIGIHAFDACSRLASVHCMALTPPNMPEGTAFNDTIYMMATLYVPYEAHEAYRNALYWQDFSHIVSINVVEPTLSGDVNEDGRVNISDVTTLINKLLDGTASGHAVNDVNGDGRVNISDVTTLINGLLSGTGGSTTVGDAQWQFLIDGVPFTMVAVKGGTFMMGSMAYTNSQPVHEVTLSDYSIGETEVTQALWLAVMRSNPGHFQGDLNRPVEYVSWSDIQTFISRLNRLTGQHFRLPTEAEWEFAARGGNKSQGTTYSGSNTIDDVAWYNGNEGTTTHPVASKAANELGLYDMSGNVVEWCQDWWENYSTEQQWNPQGPVSGEKRVYRGGSYRRNANVCASAYRLSFTPDTRAYDTGLRLALDEMDVFTVNGVSFTMVPVKGGTFMMGAADNDLEADNNEKPAHQVTLSDYSIGQTEVTQELWQAVMGYDVYLYDYDNDGVKDMNYPISVGWSNCCEFITRLNQMTGQHFRLPTEAEWEFAARGGNMSRGYKYAGSNDIFEIAVVEFDEYSDEYCCVKSPVAIKKPNELGIYDMSGNFAEWCQDYYGFYTSDAQVNPTGPVSGNAYNEHVIRNESHESDMRVTARDAIDEVLMFTGLGFRLAR